MSEVTNLIFIFGAKYLYLIIIITSCAWFLSQPKARQREILIVTCICLPLALVIFQLASDLYYNPRPFVAGNFQPLISHQVNNGFPSHHMLLVSFVSAIIFLFDRRTSLVLWALALSVGFSRVYAGLHHIVDITASLCIAIIAVTLGSFLIRIFKKR